MKPHGPIPQYHFPKKKAKATPTSQVSIWVNRPREGFTAEMAGHFIKANTEEKMPGIQYQTAKRHGVL